MNLFTRLSAAPSRKPDHADCPFIIRPDGSVISYADMMARTAQIANMLTDLGIDPGDRVAVQVEKSIDALLLYLAVLRTGGVFLPLNPAYSPAEVRYFLEDASPALFVCRPQDTDVMRKLASTAGITNILTLGTAHDGTLAKRYGDLPTTFQDIARSDSDLAAILYTSGTTGRSKGAMLSHGNLASNAATLRELWQFSSEDRLLHALPIFHSHGLFVATNTTMMAGASILLLPKFDTSEIIRLLPQASAMMGVPTYYTRLLAHPGFTREVSQHMRLFVSGSAPLSAETHREFSKRTGHAILERYGMTETNMNTSNPYTGDRVPGSVGPALPGVEVRITDQESGVPLASGVGMIEVRGPNVFSGYWQMPEKTRAEFREDGFFITGDLGYIDERGYVFIVGRAKDLIISGGFNVYPAEVEAAIDVLPGVGDCAVIGVPHPDFGEGVVAVLTQSPGGAIDKAAIMDALGQTLAKFKQPKRIIVTDALPYNAMGKVQKALLRQTYADLFQPGKTP